MRNFFLILCLFSAFGCDPLTTDFFSKIFGVDGIHPERICENNPSMFNDGRFIEVYSISESGYEKVISSLSRATKLPENSISDYGNFQKVITWRSTPCSQADLSQMDILEDIKDQNFGCFTEEDILRLLSARGNHFTFLEDPIKGYKLFILEKETRKLYHLTSFQM